MDSLEFPDEGKRNKTFTFWINVLSAVIAVVAIVSTLIFDTNPLKKAGVEVTDLSVKMSALLNQTQEVQKNHTELRFWLNQQIIIHRDSLKKLNTQNIELAQVKYDIDHLSIELSKLNAVILEDAEKALTLPLLKQQIEYLEQENARTTLVLKEEVARVYDMSKWLIGLVVTMLVSVLALNLSNLLSRQQKKPEGSTR